MAKKVLKQTCNVGGLEAPRNSLELPIEASYCAVGENIPYSYEIRHVWPENNTYTTEASMKKLINQEISKQLKPKRNAPNVVARLMGMDDTLPFDEKYIFEKKIKNCHNTNTEQKNKGIGSRGHYKFSSLGHEEFETYYHDYDINFFSSQINTKEKKPKPREHPQEEELQKFKKEFEAWQAARFKQCSKVADLENISDQFLAQETLNKEKAAIYLNSNRISTGEKPIESNEINYEICTLNKKSYSGDFDQSSSATRIVVLRPGPEYNNDNNDSRASSSCISDERGGLEDFLEEVKEKLKFELQGKIKKENMVRGGGIETRYSEKITDPKKIAQRIAKQVRESVTRDLGMSLLRSESTRSYMSEIDQFNENISPEFINRGTRRMLTEKLRKVLNKSKRFNEIEIEDMESKSFRDLAPRNLIRSLSAPISGASFGKLLLEDRHVLTGAHIRRKHEDIESVMGNLRKQKKEKSKFKERVSSIKYSFSLKGRLFGRKIQSLEQPQNYEYDISRDIRMGPTVMMNYAYRTENCSEVPPSPASVCGSSIYEEFWRETDHSSTPISDFSPLEDTTQVFREISSNLSELRKQLKELDGGGTKESDAKDHPLLSEIILEDNAHAYIRDLIVASGLHKTSSDHVLSRWDPFSKPITSQVFEEVEESYKKKVENNQESTQNKLDHKILYGLLNEALSIVLGPTMNKCSLWVESVGPTRPPRGKKLLDCAWKIVSGHLYPSLDERFLSLDGMVERDLGSNPWSKLTSEEIDALGKEIESQITGYLIQELVKEIISL